MSQINAIIAKYWAGETSLEDEAQIKAYVLSDQVQPEHLELVPLFSYFEEESSKVLSHIDLAFTQEQPFEQIAIAIDKYWAGESTISEEKQIQRYLHSGQVAAEHQDMIPLFVFFEEQEELMMRKEAIDLGAITGTAPSELEQAIAHYWAGESSLAEEQMIKDYVATGAVESKHQELVPLFHFYKAAAKIEMDKELTPVKKTEPKVRFMFPKVMAVAASLAALLMVTFTFMQDGTSYKNAYTEVEDPDEALAITMEALAFLGNKYDKGTKPMKYIKELEKTAVFNFSK